MNRYIRLYCWFLNQRFKILMEYKVNFFIGVLSTIFVQIAGLLAVWVIMQQAGNLNGWTYDEIMLLYGLITLAKSINHMFADNLWLIGRQYIVTGQLDRFLIRPINPLFHLLADRFCHDGVGNLLIGIILVARSASSLAIVWTPVSIAYLGVSVLSGGLIFIALNLITAVSAFWTMDSISLTRAVFQTHEFAKYPLSIYNRSISFLITWVIPYGFASFYPASYLLGRNVGLLAWFSPIVATLLLIASYRLWTFGLRNYTSAGS